MKEIYNFIKGDIIVRVSPSESYGTYKDDFGNIKERRDRSYMGQKLIFVGIANGQIYLKRTEQTEINLFGDKLIDLDVDMWYNGWDYYIDPNSLLDDNFLIIDETTIEQQLKEAIETENYTLASKLQLLINKKI